MHHLHKTKDHKVMFRATPTGVAIRGAITVTAKMVPKSPKTMLQRDDIEGDKMSSMMLGCHIWKLWRETLEDAKEPLIAPVFLNGSLNGYILFEIL